MTGGVLRTLIVADARVLWRDPLLVWMTAVPLGMALLIRVLARTLVNMFPDAAPAFPAYHPLVMGGYLLTAPGMIGFVIGFLLLDERDAGTLRALRVTPLSIRHYLRVSRCRTAARRHRHHDRRLSHCRSWHRSTGARSLTDRGAGADWPRRCWRWSSPRQRRTRSRASRSSRC